jgi:hypothetical protein
MEMGMTLRAEGRSVPVTVTFSNRRGDDRGEASVRWLCPCGAVMDTAAYRYAERVNVPGGYCVRCRGCGRVYVHHIDRQLVEG